MAVPAVTRGGGGAGGAPAGAEAAAAPLNILVMARAIGAAACSRQADARCFVLGGRGPLWQRRVLLPTENCFRVPASS
jgi:hypothetical protein